MPVTQTSTVPGVDMYFVSMAAVIVVSLTVVLASSVPPKKKTVSE
jgi:hypothetical protein